MEIILPENIVDFLLNDSYHFTGFPQSIKDEVIKFLNTKRGKSTLVSIKFAINNVNSFDDNEEFKIIWLELFKILLYSSFKDEQIKKE